MPFGRCECNPCEHNCAQPARLREENALLRTRLDRVVGAAQALRTAVTFGPISVLSPGNRGWEARVPRQFVADLDDALAGVKPL